MASREEASQARKNFILQCALATTFGLEESRLLSESALHIGGLFKAGRRGPGQLNASEAGSWKNLDNYNWDTLAGGADSFLSVTAFLTQKGHIHVRFLESLSLDGFCVSERGKPLQHMILQSLLEVDALEPGCRFLWDPIFSLSERQVMEEEARLRIHDKRAINRRTGHIFWTGEGPQGLHDCLRYRNWPPQLKK